MKISLAPAFIPEIETDDASIEDLRKVAELLRATSELLNAATQSMPPSVIHYMDSWQALTMKAFFDLAKAGAEKVPADEREARNRHWLIASARAEDDEFLEGVE